MGEQNVFQFQYTALTVKVTVSGDTMSIKQGLRTFTVPLSALKGFYVQDYQKDMKELILAYEKERGKNKVVRTYSNVGQPDFDRLVAYLSEEKPEADLRSLPVKEAYAKLGAVNMNRAAMISVPIILIVVMSVLVLPFLIHGVDKGLERVSVEMLTSGYVPQSRNLELVGVLDGEHGLVETITRKGTTTTHNYYPVMPVGAPAGTPISVVLEFSSSGEAEIDQAAAQGLFRCVLRNVLWEGISSDNKDFFKTEYGLPLADTVHLCELGINTSMSLAVFFIAVGVTAVIMIIVFIALKRQQRKSK